MSNRLPSQFSWSNENSDKFLRIYSKHRANFSGPPEKKRKMWGEIADEVQQKCSVPCNGDQCSAHIKRLRRQYEQFKKEHRCGTTPRMDCFMAEAKKAFETNVHPVIPLCDASTKRWNHTKNTILLKVYAQYKAELSSPDVKEETVWKKIAEEVRERTSLDCDEIECRKKIEGMKCEYERNKNQKGKGRKVARDLDKLAKFFGPTENSDELTAGQSSSKRLQHCSRKNRKYLLSLLQVYSKYKTELNSPGVDNLTVWRKIAREIRENYFFNCGESVCRLDISHIKELYKKFKKNQKPGGKPFYLDEARQVFDEIDVKPVISPGGVSSGLPVQNCELDTREHQSWYPVANWDTTDDTKKQTIIKEERVDSPISTFSTTTAVPGSSVWFLDNY